MYLARLRLFSKVLSVRSIRPNTILEHARKVIPEGTPYDLVASRGERSGLSGLEADLRILCAQEQDLYPLIQQMARYNILCTVTFPMKVRETVSPLNLPRDNFFHEQIQRLEEFEDSSMRRFAHLMKRNVSRRQLEKLNALRSETAAFERDVLHHMREQLWLGRSINCIESSDMTPLKRAILGNHTELVQLFLAHGADPNLSIQETPLQLAAEYKRFDQIRLLITAGADPNLLTEENPCPPLIMIANLMPYEIENHIVEAAQLLLRNGANPNASCFNGPYTKGTVLTEAVWAGNEALVRFWIDQRFDLNQPGKDDLTPLATAKIASTNMQMHFLEKRRRIVQMLEQAGAKEK